MDRFRLRVWNNKIKEFVDPMDWSYWDLCFWYEPYKQDIEPVLMDTDYYEIEQCTGLKDKNGKLIYERDILQSGEQRIRVVFDEQRHCFMFDYQDTHAYKPISCIDVLDSDKFEVIGNIHENKGSLEVMNE